MDAAHTQPGSVPPAYRTRRQRLALAQAGIRKGMVETGGESGSQAAAGCTALACRPPVGTLAVECETVHHVDTRTDIAAARAALPHLREEDAGSARNGCRCATERFEIRQHAQTVAQQMACTLYRARRCRTLVAVQAPALAVRPADPSDFSVWPQCLAARQCWW